MTSIPADMADRLRLRADLIARELDALPPLDPFNRKPYDDAVASLVDRLKGLPEGAAVTFPGDAASIKMFSLRSSSTAGMTAALRHWMDAAKRKCGDT